jgi:hypothetical protein
MPIELGNNSLLSAPAPTLKKPPYLITLDNGMNGKTRLFHKFISLDKPRAENGLLEVKGFFCENDDIIKNFNDIVVGTSKELHVEMMFPLHRIVDIQNLVFNAVKTITPVIAGKQ